MEISCFVSRVTIFRFLYLSIHPYIYMYLFLCIYVYNMYESPLSRLTYRLTPLLYKGCLFLIPSPLIMFYRIIYRFENRLISLFESISKLYKQIPSVLKSEQIKVKNLCMYCTFRFFFLRDPPSSSSSSSLFRLYFFL